MKKTNEYSVILLLILVLVFNTSCKKVEPVEKKNGPVKEEEKPVEEEESAKENFLEEYLSQTEFNEMTDTTVNVSNFELGVEFSPVVSGKLTDILVKLPDVRNDLRVTLWNTSDTTILYSDVLDVSSAHEMFTFDIDDIELTKNSIYAMSMNSNDYYLRSREDAGNITYPIQANNINILKYGFKGGSLQEYPDNFPLKFYSGDLSFNFQPTQ